MADVTIVTTLLRASIKLLSAERRARADHLHIEARANIYNYFADIIAEEIPDNLLRV